jgi:hypothetical protein
LSATIKQEPLKHGVDDLRYSIYAERRNGDDSAQWGIVDNCKEWYTKALVDIPMSMAPTTRIVVLTTSLIFFPKKEKYKKIKKIEIFSNFFLKNPKMT